MMLLRGALLALLGPQLARSLQAEQHGLLGGHATLAGAAADAGQAVEDGEGCAAACGMQREAWTIKCMRPECAGCHECEYGMPPPSGCPPGGCPPGGDR
mmetsp:Transcript_97326/g.253660  ORF Transcript_97326/g.253660 Transcript_97326/m.253660 type:complete len:99 (+) Transcript_97326:113-409(+)